MRWLKRFLALVAATVLTLLGALLALFLWLDSDRSLAATLDLAARHLPADQTLEVKEVTGSLRSGGRIGWLRWQQGDLRVEARDTELAWTLRGLLDGQLRLRHLRIGHLLIDDRRASQPGAPLAQLVLPLQVDAPFEVGTVEWVGTSPLQLTGLSGVYVFDSKEHRIDAGKVQLSSGKYRFAGRLQAQSPMALSLDVQGEVLTPVPGTQQTLTVLASAAARGQLAGGDATVAVSALLTSQSTLATVSAIIQPWQPQPVVSAHAKWQALDLAALWPQAPSTLLRGQGTVAPQAGGWLAEMQLDNARPGPWDRHQLPVATLQARATHVGGQWVINSLAATGAGGRIQARGQVELAGPADPIGRNGSAPTPLSWSGSGTFQDINPAAIDARLATESLDGQLNARLTHQGLFFDTQLQSTLGKPGATTSPGTKAGEGLRLHLRSLQAKGRWASPLLTLQAVDLHTLNEQIQGSVTLNLTTLAAEGQLNLRVPGANATLSGQISSATGLGALKVQMTDATLTSRWLASWPVMPDALARTTVKGAGELTGQWRGGWQHQGRELQVQAALSLPRLDLQATGAGAEQAWRFGPAQAELSGSLAALRLSTSVAAGHGTRRFNLQTQARAGRAGDGAWQGTLETLKLQAQDSLQVGTWTLQLEQGVTLDWKGSASARVLAVSAGEASLASPASGVARLSWLPARWSQRDAGPAQWRSQGQIQALPLRWLELVGGVRFADLGGRGDMVLGGQWDVSAGESLRLRASLERTSGDLKLQPDDHSPLVLSAGVREAYISLRADGEDLSASVRWDSEHAGQVQGRFQSRLQRLKDGWAWPADTPVTGSVRVQMPRLAIWSALAPPGWRLRGTLNADATLGGTRDDPQWRGTLQAGDLAVRSVADGIDFQQGQLRASLNGQRLDIDEFSLKGASGTGEGGTLKVKGFVLWAPPDGPAAAGLARVRMELEALAEGLRVSTQADRRLAVSGRISAKLVDAALVVRGTLKADQALIILPDDTAPRLGADVAILPANGKGAKPAPGSSTAPAPAPAPAGAAMTRDISITLDLGPDFQLKGHGLTTRLAGRLNLTSMTPGAPQPRLTGEIRTVRGTYRAYGQLLDIEAGVLRFVGPYDNPFLDVRAIRPHLTQRVGVQITGTVLSPRVRLYAEPDLPEAEKLAWLVLGRSGANGGAEAAMLQQAALALLGGNAAGLSGGLAPALGLDELSVRASTQNADGSATGATVTLGRRLSRDFYVAYERSLAGALGTFYVFYDLSRRLTLRAQSGEQNAVDLIFTIRYD